MNRTKIMKLFRLLIFAITSIPLYIHAGNVNVNGYYRSNGTYVAPYSYSKGTTSSNNHSTSTGGSFNSSAPEYQPYPIKPVPTKPRNDHGLYIVSTSDKVDTSKLERRLYENGQLVHYIDGKRIIESSATDISTTNIKRDSHGRIKRSETAKHDFQQLNPCPATGSTSGSCPGYVIDHITALKRGGKDAPENMQWQTIEEGKAKDRWE